MLLASTNKQKCDFSDEPKLKLVTTSPIGFGVKLSWKCCSYSITQKNISLLIITWVRKMFFLLIIMREIGFYFILFYFEKHWDLNVDVSIKNIRDVSWATSFRP